MDLRLWLLVILIESKTLPTHHVSLNTVKLSIAGTIWTSKSVWGVREDIYNTDKQRLESPINLIKKKIENITISYYL